MNVLARLRGWSGDRDWLLTVLSVVGVVGLGMLIGQQYMMPDKRVIPVAVGLVVFGIAWRLDLVSGVGLLVLVLPFPRYTTFGSTNLAILLLLLVVWLLRYSQREAPGPRPTPLDAPLAGMTLAYVVSFYNVRQAFHLEGGIQRFILFLSCLMLFFLVVHNVRNEKGLRKFHLFQTVAIALIHAFCLWELAFPGTYLIPGWIDLRGINVELFQTRNYRVGGPWVDYELLSEFAALNIVFFIFMIAQARSATRRVIFTMLLGSSMLIMFATVTRGGIAALVVGLGYLLYKIRRRTSIVPLTLIGGAAALAVIGLAYFVKEYTVAGDVFARFGDTRFVGITPESRSEVWGQAWERWMLHPLIGHGPFYGKVHGLKLWYWPHNLPLFLGNCFGFLGLGMFTWIVWKLWKLSVPQTERLNDPDYVKAFQLVARVQLVIFLVDEMKIEYLRNTNYLYQPWVLFSTLAAAGMILRERDAAARATSAAPIPALLATATSRR
ncbi:MAG: O-antigen ligase family protein [Candidatus Eisenbacteria bacterium]